MCLFSRFFLYKPIATNRFNGSTDFTFKPSIFTGKISGILLNNDISLEIGKILLYGATIQMGINFIIVIRVNHEITLLIRHEQLETV